MISGTSGHQKHGDGTRQLARYYFSLVFYSVMPTKQRAGQCFDTVGWASGRVSGL